MTKRIRTRRANTGLTIHKYQELLTGKILFDPKIHWASSYDGYADNYSELVQEFGEMDVRPYSGFTIPPDRLKPCWGEMRTDWKRFGEAIIRFLVLGYEYYPAFLPKDADMNIFGYGPGGAGNRPWAWWKFDAPEKRSESESPSDYLYRNGLLIPGEIDIIRENSKTELENIRHELRWHEDRAAMENPGPVGTQREYYVEKVEKYSAILAELEDAVENGAWWIS